MRTADFFTLLASAVRNNLDVWAGFHNILDRLLAGETDCESRRPGAWRRARPEAIRSSLPPRALRATVAKSPGSLARHCSLAFSQPLRGRRPAPTDAPQLSHLFSQ
ncbi:MAG: hypothetical protein KF688_15020 [Pirellulales bacterium]|nr:hypothetical protein [Pirellulales bacterium]